MYGNRVYPAGDYEALRVSIGKAEGQNWWCVLFPPLCFVDAVSNEAVAAKTDDGGKAASVDGAGAGTGDKPAGKSGEMSGERSTGKAADGMTKASKLEKTNGTSASGKPVALAKAGDGKAAQVAMAVTAAQQQEEGKTEYKFFLWELLKKLISLFK
jgi:stage II sporulation protein R